MTYGRSQPSSWVGGAAILKRHVVPQDGLFRAIYLTDVHANAAGFERIVGQMSKR